MGTVTTVTSVSHAYYSKRHRRVAEGNIRSMSRALGRPEPQGLGRMEKSDLISMALSLHREMPDD